MPQTLKIQSIRSEGPEIGQTYGLHPALRCSRICLIKAKYPVDNLIRGRLHWADGGREIQERSRIKPGAIDYRLNICMTFNLTYSNMIEENGS
jgi:hypothetical protein